MSNSSISSAFPSIFVPEKEKDEAYHRNFAQAVASKGILSGFTDRRAIMNECVNFFLGLQGGQEFEFLQKAEDGEVLPAKWMDYNKIAVKIELLIGELAQRGYVIDVKAYNKAAQVRRLEERSRLLTEMRFAPIADLLEEEVGLPIQSDSSFIPENEQKLDIYMNKSYKETSEIVMKAMLEFLKKSDDWDYARLALFRDMLIMGMAVARHEIVDGLPHMERVDPRNVIFDGAAKDDFLKDSTYWGEVMYMSLGEIVRRWPKIKKQDLQDAFKNYNDWFSNPSHFASFSGDFGFLDRNTTTRCFVTEQGEIRALVVRSYWQDIKNITRKYSEDSQGQTHVKKPDSSAMDAYAKGAPKGKNIKDTPIQAWRYAVLIGGKFVAEHGWVENQERNVDNIATTTPPYIACIPNFINGAIVSKVHRLKNLQNLKNIVMYNVMLEISKAGGKSFVYDLSMLPKGWDHSTAMRYLRTANIAFIDSSADNAGTFNQFAAIDLSLSDAVDKFINLSIYIDREMDSISGVNDARQGLLQGASQGQGVTNSALAQSSMSTALYNQLFSNFFSKCLNKQAGLGKIAWAGKERFAPIIGDVGVDFLEIDIPLDLNDYNVFVQELPPVVNDQQLFYQLVLAGIQSSQIDFVGGLKLLLEKDLNEGVQNLEIEMKRREQMAQAQQEALQQQEQEAQQAASAQADQSNKVKLAIAQQKSQADQYKILTQGKLDLKQSLLDFKEDLALKKIDAAIQRAKAKEKSKATSKK